MIRILGKIPSTVTLACSGGVDSMFALSFLRGARSREVYVLFIHHRTETSEKASAFLEKYCKEQKVVYAIKYINKFRNPLMSLEEFWHHERNDIYKWINSPVVMAHHLNDQMENWLMTAAHGQPRLMPYKRENIIRPFLLVLKEEMIAWCKSKRIPWQEDETNTDTKYNRNRVRQNILPEYLKLNPGFAKVIRRMVKDEFSKI